ncbi:unnamed protein product [Triticum turgidum subsp. durum]|uniref:NmrA-like domain-containing protein n=1 Tax=Triticum turgidum subsp. durum TaxID=4567 RepID=A0A9R0QA65_TRITD|nr:unnamed protein product [Triticum turgidum subsp. durum]
MASDGKSKILVIGATGYIGRHVVAASARLGHPTLALVRDAAPSDPAKAQLLKTFQDSGVTLLTGDLYDHGSLLSAVKAADVVISTLGSMQIADQTKLIAAIKEAGNVKRFFPSEFGLDVDRTGAVEPAKSILGDGETKVVFVDEADIGTYTVLAADDPRAENKVLYIKPPANTLSHNELASLWEKKTGKTFQRVYVPEDAVLKQIQEASELYPDVKYTTVDDLLNRFL